MVIEDRVSAVMSALQRAGREKTTLSFRSLHALFASESDSKDVYETLECASRELADLQDAIPSVLVAKKNGGLPGDGFFDIFRHKRSEEYENIASGLTPIPMLTQTQRQQMADIERTRVYAYAAAHGW